MSLNLQRFCANDTDPREYLYKPWRDGKWVYATNGHMLVRVAADLFPGADDKPAAAPNASGLFAKWLDDRPGLDSCSCHQCRNCKTASTAKAPGRSARSSALTAPMASSSTVSISMSARTAMNLRPVLAGNS
ncbi:MAG: hypothetical protein Q8N17_26325 [Burkholderiaceae bacterium]|nr:hypothetical protein [Burkholderiaceae bacterium]